MSCDFEQGQVLFQRPRSSNMKVLESSMVRLIFMYCRIELLSLQDRERNLFLFLNKYKRNRIHS